MTDLKGAPNLGKVLIEKLDHAGIHSLEELKILGSEQAFLRILAIDNNACLNMLFALEGAIQDIRWHNLPAGRKTELTYFFNQVQKS